MNQIYTERQTVASGSTVSFTVDTFCDISGSVSGMAIGNSGTLTVTDCLFYNISTTADGAGAINIDSTGITRIVGSTFRANGGSEGAAIRCYRSKLFITDTLFYGNWGAKGVVFNQGTGSVVNLSGVTFSGNQCSDGRGALHNHGYGAPEIVLSGKVVFGTGGSDFIYSSTSGGNFGKINVDIPTLFADSDTWYRIVVDASAKNDYTLSTGSWLKGTVTTIGGVTEGYTAIADGGGYTLVKGDFTAAAIVTAQADHAFADASGTHYAGNRYSTVADALSSSELDIIAVVNGTQEAVEIGTGKTLFYGGEAVITGSLSGDGTAAANGANLIFRNASDITMKNITVTDSSLTFNNAGTVAFDASQTFAEGISVNILSSGFTTGSYTLATGLNLTDAAFTIDGIKCTSGQKIYSGDIAVQFTYQDSALTLTLAVPTEVNTSEDWTTMGDGKISLRKAVGYAGVGGTVTFDPEVTTAKLDSALSINCTVQGNGAGVTTIDGPWTLVNNGAAVLRDIAVNTHLGANSALQNLTLDRAKVTVNYSGDGAFIMGGIKLTAVDTLFTGNYGGKEAIMYLTGGTASFSRTTFSSNYADRNGIILAQGASIFMSDVTFTGNSGRRGEGALFIDSSSSLTLTGKLTFGSATLDSLRNKGTVNVIGSSFFTGDNWFATVIDASAKNPGTSTSSWLQVLPPDQTPGTITVIGDYDVIQDANGYYLVSGEYTSAGFVSNDNIHASELNEVRYAGMRYGQFSSALDNCSIVVLINGTQDASAALGEGKKLIYSGEAVIKGGVTGAGTVEAVDAELIFRNTSDITLNNIAVTNSSLTFNNAGTVTFDAGQTFADGMNIAISTAGLNCGDWTLAQNLVLTNAAFTIDGKSCVSGEKVDFGDYSVSFTYTGKTLSLSYVANTEVNTSEDWTTIGDGIISLRKAVGYAGVGGTVTFASKVTTAKLDSPLSINCTVQGNGAEVTTIDGPWTLVDNGAAVLRDIAVNTHLEANSALQNLTLDHAKVTVNYSGLGAFIMNGIKLTAVDTLFTGNYGGNEAILYLTSGTASFAGTTFSSNYAAKNGILLAQGASIFMSDVTFTGNSVGNGRGALFIDSSSSLTLTGKLTFGTATQDSLRNIGTVNVIGSSFFTGDNWFATVIDASSRNPGKNPNATWLQVNSNAISVTGDYSAIQDANGYYLVSGEYTSAGFVSNDNIHTFELGSERYAGVRYDKFSSALADCQQIFVINGKLSGYDLVQAEKSVYMRDSIIDQQLQNYGTVTMTGTMGINANMLYSGAYLVQDAAITFGNTSTINIDGMTFSGTNSMNFTGKAVTFNALDLTGVEVSVTGDFSELKNYTVAGGLTALDSTVSVNDTAWQLNSTSINADKTQVQALIFEQGTLTFAHFDTVYLVTKASEANNINRFISEQAVKDKYGADHQLKISEPVLLTAFNAQWTSGNLPESIQVGTQTVPLTWGTNAFNSIDDAKSAVAFGGTIAAVDGDFGAKSVITGGYDLYVIGGTITDNRTFCSYLSGGTVTGDTAITMQDVFTTTIDNILIQGTGEADTSVIDGNNTINLNGCTFGKNVMGVGCTVTGNHTINVKNVVFYNSAANSLMLAGRSPRVNGVISCIVSGSTLGGIGLYSHTIPTFTFAGLTVSLTDSTASGLGLGSRGNLINSGDSVVTLTGSTTGTVSFAKDSDWGETAVLGDRILNINGVSAIDGDIWGVDFLNVSSGSSLAFSGATISGGTTAAVTIVNNGTITVDASIEAGNSYSVVAAYDASVSKVGTITAAGFTGGVTAWNGSLYAFNTVFVDNTIAGAGKGDVITVGGFKAVYGINAFASTADARENAQQAAIMIVKDDVPGNCYGDGMLVIADGSVAKTTYGGKLVTSGTVDAGESFLSVSGGTFASMVVGGSRVSTAAGDSAEVSSARAALYITGGSFSAEKGYLVTAGYVINKGDGASLNVTDSALTLKGNVEVKKYAFGGAFADNGTATVNTVNVSVSDGSYGSVFAGGWAQNKGTVNVAGATVNVSGGIINNLYAGGTDSGAGNASAVTAADINISGGTVRNIFLNGKYSRDTVNTAKLTISGTADLDIRWIDGLCHSLTKGKVDTVSTLDIKRSFTVEDILHVDTWDFTEVGSTVTFADGHKADLDGDDAEKVNSVLNFTIAQALESDWTALVADTIEGCSQATVRINNAAAESFENNIWSFAGDYRAKFVAEGPEGKNAIIVFNK